MLDKICAKSVGMGRWNEEKRLHKNYIYKFYEAEQTGKEKIAEWKKEGLSGGARRRWKKLLRRQENCVWYEKADRLKSVKIQTVRILKKQAKTDKTAFFAENGMPVIKIPKKRRFILKMENGQAKVRYVKNEKINV